MVEAPTRWPSLSSSPWILRYPQFGFSPRHPCHQRDQDVVDRRPSGPVRVDPSLANELAVPAAESCPGLPGGGRAAAVAVAGSGRRRSPGRPSPGVVSGWCGGAQRPRGVAPTTRRPWSTSRVSAARPVSRPAGRSGTTAATTRRRSCPGHWWPITAGQQRVPRSGTPHGSTGGSWKRSTLTKATGVAHPTGKPAEHRPRALQPAAATAPALDPTNLVIAEGLLKRRCRLLLLAVAHHDRGVQVDHQPAQFPTGCSCRRERRTGQLSSLLPHQLPCRSPRAAECRGVLRTWPSGDGGVMGAAAQNGTCGPE
jgi:hypothetical protein